MSRADAEDGGKSSRVRARVAEMVARTGAGAPRIPCWEPGRLPMPNVFLAASVFGLATPQAPPVVVHRMPLEAAAGYSVLYTGRLLTQTHGDLVMALMALAGRSEEGSSLTVRARDLERVLELGSGRRNRDSLETLLHDIGGAQLIVRSSAVRLYGTLLPFGRLEGDVHTLRINRELMELAHGGFTLVDLNARRRLARKPLAQWLQLYTAWLDSQGVRALELEQVRRVSRSSMEPRMLRFRTRRALVELESVGARPWRLGADDWLRAG